MYATYIYIYTRLFVYSIHRSATGSPGPGPIRSARIQAWLTEKGRGTYPVLGVLVWSLGF